VARRSDEIVSEIRAHRRRLRSQVEGVATAQHAAERVRSRPIVALGIALVAGVVVGRVLGPQLVRAGRRRLTSEARSRAGTGLAALALAAFGLGKRGGRAGAMGAAMGAAAASATASATVSPTGSSTAASSGAPGSRRRRP
jgi:hypothetical protein